MSKAELSNASTSNTPPDRGSAPAGGGVAPGDVPASLGGPKPDLERPASQGGSYQRDQPTAAERARRR
jgi:hypothetical protein